MQELIGNDVENVESAMIQPVDHVQGNQRKSYLRDHEPWQYVTHDGPFELIRGCANFHWHDSECEETRCVLMCRLYQTGDIGRDATGWTTEDHLSHKLTPSPGHRFLIRTYILVILPLLCINAGFTFGL